MPIPSFTFEIYRGLAFPGWQLLALDKAGNPVAQDVGTTYLLQARKTPSGTVEFELPVVRGTEATGQILIESQTEAQTALFDEGEFVYDLVPIDATSKAWPPILTGIVKVIQPVSQPA